ncbi:MAG: acetyl-CoA carboxylase biotin carboxylase subunit [Armatimonadetes bacterium]|nr:acetyl-CoA carboxylase biotin carboxylase subunit [Armatimonadota bacterium]
MFRKLLVANRGEIAVRVIRACHEMGIATVAVYSEADRTSMHVKMADEAFCIGPAPSPGSYLNIPNIMSTAELTGVDAVHPGYGFLAENPRFAEIVADCKIAFVGPHARAIELMGDKAAARVQMQKAGVPIIPGTRGTVSGVREALDAARATGYPLVIKAAAGGGGRGMRIAQTAEDLPGALQSAQQEAAAAFGDGRVYIEKYLQEPRHIEVQVLADAHGAVLHLGTRDCSIQRRHQKLIEESPPPRLRERTLAALGRAAVRAAEAIGYVNAGTVEFLVDAHDDIYFMEMNTRIQVEHPVTEAVTGLDLVKEQIRIAAGEKLRFGQRDVEFRGHALECRINAEDTRHGFRPSAGTITGFIPPGGPGVRVDTHCYPGYAVPPNYDSLIAKVIAWGRDREEAIMRMRRALLEFEVEGIHTTIPFHLKVLDNAFFRRGEVYTNFVARRIEMDVF